MNCACGQSLPTHLAVFAKGDKDFTHVCSCERAYKVDAEGAFVLVGRQKNPFAEYDRARGEA